MTTHLLIVCGFGIAMTEPSSCDQEVLAQKAENVYYLAVGSECAHLLIQSNNSNAPPCNGASWVQGTVWHCISTAK